MVSPRLALFTLVSTLVGAAVADFHFISPGGPDLWWVAQSQNTLVWSCNDSPPATAYQLLVNNTNPTILAAAEAIVANIQNSDCSHTITVQQAVLTPATGYTLIFADTLDQTKIYATSEAFEVKALGAAYPPTSATPTGSATSTSGSSGSSTASGSTSSSTKQANSAFTSFQVSGAGVLAAVGAAIGML
ncbi:hypothetical protein EDB86DRAFT_2805513 [Lactarius hatsudake]|nr:hypothetical protein EDB86DRAFT_2805513 [Lactarius hatsudake]